MSDIATLGLRVDAQGYITSVGEAKRATRELGETGERTRGQLSGFDAAVQRIGQDVAMAERHFNSGTITLHDYRTAIAMARQEADRLGIAGGSELSRQLLHAEVRARAASEATRDLARASAEAAEAVGVESGPGLTGRLNGAGHGAQRLNMTLASLLRQMVGVHPAIGQLVSVLGTLAIGSTVMVGVMLGLAAVAGAWQRIAGEAREAKRELEDALDVLKELARTRLMGEAGELRGQADLGRQELTRRAAEINELARRVSGGVPLDEAGAVAFQQDVRRLERLRQEYAELEAEVVAGESALAQIRRDSDQRNADEEQRRNDARLRDHERFLAEMIRQEEAAARERLRILSELDARIGFGPGAPSTIRAASVAGAGFGADRVQLNEGGRARFEADQDRRARFLASGGTLDQVSGPGSFADRNPGAGGGGGIMGMIGQFAGGLGAAVKGLLASFGPLAVAAAALKPVFEGVMEVLGPIMETIGEPLKALGRIIGIQLQPAFKLLAWMVQRAVTIISYFTEGLGRVIWALGWFVDKVTFGFRGWGDALMEHGNTLVDASRAARNNAGAVDEMTDAIRRASANIPDIAPLALWRYRTAGTGVPGGGTAPGGLPPGGGGNGGGGTGDGNEFTPTGRMTIDMRGATVVTQAPNAREFFDDMEREAQRRRRSGQPVLLGAI